MWNLDPKPCIEFEMDAETVYYSYTVKLGTPVVGFLDTCDRFFVKNKLVKFAIETMKLCEKNVLVNTYYHPYGIRTTWRW